jgi:hypothetical protein
MFPFNYVFSKPLHIIGVEFHKECYVGVCSMPWFQEVVLRTNIMQFGRYLPCTYFVGFHENSYSLHSLSLNNVFHMQWKELSTLSFSRKIYGSKCMISCYTLHACSQRFFYYWSFIVSLKLPLFSFKKQFTYTKINYNCTNFVMFQALAFSSSIYI